MDSTGRPARRRADANANAASIVKAARDVFAHDGTATLSQVAAAAGVANATLYRHFPNRRALAAAVFAEILATEIKPTIRALGADAPRQGFLEALVRLEDVMFEQRALLASLDDLADLTRQIVLRDLADLEDMIADARATGGLRADITTEDIAVFVAMVTTASVAMNQPRTQRRRYLHLMLDAFNPSDAQQLPGP